MQYESSLYHHGIKGMKWGVRRYQNEDGTYTQRGLARYRKAQENYDKSVEKRSAAKKAYKFGTGTKEAYKSAKQEVKKNKKVVSKEYDKLKQDKLADEGKALYRKGKTISGNTELVTGIATAAGIGAKVVQAFVQAKTGDTRIANISAALVATGGAAVSAILKGKNYRENKRLRAYYAH